MASKKKAGASKRGGVLGKLEPVLINVEAPKAPPIPTQSLVAEGYALAKVASKYGKELTRVGVDKKLLTSLGDRTRALAEAQAEVVLARKKKRTAKELKLEARGVELRSDLVAAARFALRDDEDAQAAIDRIQEGEGLDDLVQDLRDLAAFAKEHKSELARIGLKAEAKAEEATKLAAALEDVVAERRIGDADEQRSLALRDRAATYLLEAMREVRAAGAYAFRRKPEIAARFRGTYSAQVRARARARAKSAPAVTNGQPQP